MHYEPFACPFHLLLVAYDATNIEAGAAARGQGPDPHRGRSGGGWDKVKPWMPETTMPGPRPGYLATLSENKPIENGIEVKQDS